MLTEEQLREIEARYPEWVIVMPGEAVPVKHSESVYWDIKQLVAEVRRLRRTVDDLTPHIKPWTA